MSVSRAREILAKAATEQDRTTRHLQVAAAIDEAFDRALIVVGGTAEDYYTGDIYTETDLDMCGSVGAEETATLVELGFERSGRHWYHEPSHVAVEFPDDRLAGSLERVFKVPVEGRQVNLIGVDDLYLDRVRQSTATEPPEERDVRAALAIAIANYDHMDWRYVEEIVRAEPEGSVRARMTRNHRRIYRRVLRAVDQGTT